MYTSTHWLKSYKELKLVNKHIVSVPAYGGAIWSAADDTFTVACSYLSQVLWSGSGRESLSSCKESSQSHRAARVTSIGHTSYDVETRQSANEGEREGQSGTQDPGMLSVVTAIIVLCC